MFMNLLFLVSSAPNLPEKFLQTNFLDCIKELVNIIVHYKHNLKRSMARKKKVKSLETKLGRQNKFIILYDGETRDISLIDTLIIKDTCIPHQF